MQGLLSAIGVLFGKLMYFIYNTVGLHNYALSLVLFTLVYKIILLPLSVKQMKASQKCRRFSPIFRESRQDTKMIKKNCRKRL